MKIANKTNIELKREGLICLRPFSFIDIFYEKVYACCPDWTKVQIGDISSQTIAEMWNGEQIRYIRRKIYAGEWQDICNPCCPHINLYLNTGMLNKYEYLDYYPYLNPMLIENIRAGKEYLDTPPTVFKIDNSSACNINCIMCTRQMYRDDPVLIEKTARDVETYLPTAKSVVLTGMGDPLVIKYTREWIKSYDGSNNELQFELITNGLLLPKYWNQIKHQRFGPILISIDAATKQTYEHIRQGGTWEQLQEALNLVCENKDRFPSVAINMTVMRSNFREISAFINVAESYGFNATFQQIRGQFGKENMFSLNDTKALRELGAIVREEQKRKRRVEVFMPDLLPFAQ